MFLLVILLTRFPGSFPQQSEQMEIKNGPVRRKNTETQTLELGEGFRNYKKKSQRNGIMPLEGYWSHNFTNSVEATFNWNENKKNWT